MPKTSPSHLEQADAGSVPTAYMQVTEIGYDQGVLVDSAVAEKHRGTLMTNMRWISGSQVQQLRVEHTWIPPMIHG
jgi:hypothetical protein